MSVEELVPREPGRVHAASYDDVTLARLEADATVIKARYPQERSALLPLLHLVQSQDGYVSPRGIAFCAQTLGLTTAEVSAVATFYTQYKRHPNGDYTVGVCTNTLCAVMGGDAIYEHLCDHLGIGHDETTEDGKVTLERVECNAACDYAPVVMVNWEFFDNQTPESAAAVVDALRAGEPVAPTRGADQVVTFKEMSRVLAGFPDGRADEGVGAGEATLRGTVLAHEQGWTAPPLPGQDEPRRTSTRTTTRARTGTARAAASEPRTGDEQSSAERPVTGERDASSQQQETKQASSDAKED